MIIGSDSDGFTFAGMIARPAAISACTRRDVLRTAPAPHDSPSRFAEDRNFSRARFFADRDDSISGVITPHARSRLRTAAPGRARNALPTRCTSARGDPRLPRMRGRPFGDVDFYSGVGVRTRGVMRP